MSADSPQQSGERPVGPPADIERRIRAAGAVIDKQFVNELYAPLLVRQPREGVLFESDLAYGDHARHRLDLYRPTETSRQRLPALLFLHGGGFIRGDKSEKENVGRYFARQGFLVAIANYRLAPASSWPAGAEDVLAALTWLHRNAGQLGVDTNRVVVAGESAGAAHVATAILMKRFNAIGTPAIAGMVLVSGVYDVELEAMARRQFGTATPDPRNDAYFGSDPARYASMSVVRNIEADPVPTLITYAELDPPQMQVQAGALFAELVRRHGFDADLHVVRGHNHLTQVYCVNTGDESLTAPILRFLHEHC